ncbi:hypothetical protein ACIRUL_17540 [Streptomyces sp. NPDC101171]|uniref:hypothetical protein n=1 Tax=Streptomyces sp. NPDC101171 TaxID=3366122 RepID=UPI0037FD2BCA
MTTSMPWWPRTVTGAAGAAPHIWHPAACPPPGCGPGACGYGPGACGYAPATGCWATGAG